MKRNQIIGKKFGKLTVISDKGNTKAGHSKWLCKCDCGKEVVRTATSLLRSKNSSCGCWSVFGKDNLLWQGVGEISKNWFYNVIVRAASGRKSRSGISKKLDITIEDIWELFIKQNRKCALSGLELTFPIKNNNVELKKSTASLDRIDSSKGYTKDNIQWVHKNINIMKNVYSQEYFIEMCKLVTKNSIK